MSNVSPHLCAEADEVAESVLFKALVAVKMILAALGSLCILVLFKKKRSSWIANPNARLLYYGHCYFAFHATTFFIVVYLYDLIRFSFAVERAISTFYIESYERVKSQKFGILLIALSVVLACSMHFFWTFLPVPEDVYVASLTIRTPQNSQSYQVATFIPFCLEVSTFTIFGLTYYFNVRKHTRRPFVQRLGRKYQIAENKFLIRALFPCFFTHFLLSVFTYVGIYLYPVFFPTFETVTSAVWVEIFSQSPNYALLMPWILIWQKKKSSRIDTLRGISAADDHFRRFNEMLNKS